MKLALAFECSNITIGEVWKFTKEDVSPSDILSGLVGPWPLVVDNHWAP